jgi:hypothetical protein
MASPDFGRATEIADAILFEGYVLYPYRASAMKNQLRWQFGVLAPQGSDPSETSFAQTECLVEPRGEAVLHLRLRFLHLRTREGDTPWDEGVVREIDTKADISDGAETDIPFEVLGEEDSASLHGVIRTSAHAVPGPYGLMRVRLRIENTAEGTPGGLGGIRREGGLDGIRREGGLSGIRREESRPEMLRRSLVAAHTLLAVSGGTFLSLADPPRWARGAAEACQNLHTWPILIDETTVLSSPIILDDRPEVAPESQVPFYDATEIDELLVLRTMTLTDEEKQEARATDPRAAEVIDRADSIPPEVFARLHGAIRSVEPASEPSSEPDDTWAKPSVPWWDPGADRSVSPETDTAEISGGVVSRGSKVRIRPGRRRTDAQDLFLHGRVATVEAVLLDVDGQTHIAVTIDDDPAAELNAAVGRFRYFAPDELEPA